MGGGTTGQSRMRPSGTVTFLFTDVEGSTQSWDRDGEAMDAALRLHDHLVRAAVERRGGYVFATAGDSFAVAFAGAGDAVGAAVEAQRLLGAAPWPETAVLRVRMGLHSGQATERDGDYFGAPVNRAARLMATGHGGQIVCSRLTADLAIGRLDAGIRFEGVGELWLPGVHEPIPACRVLADGLAADLPPPRSLDGSRRRLPLPPTRLVGRAVELTRIAELVRTHRLVTLTGVGGAGKTRLALAAAAELAAEFAEGAELIELAPIGEPGRVAGAVAEALSLRVTGDAGSTVPAVAQLVSSRQLLLVLDNAEHVLHDVAELAEELLSAGEHVHVLVTSREALGVDGEYQLRVPSLPTDGADSPAVELLVDRAREVNDTLVWDDRARAVGAEICRRLDGIPLAIELAAGQLGALGPKQLLDRLDRRFELLVGGRSRRRSRQQTLQATMQWSWELLDRDEQGLLAELSVFAGGWTLEAAEAVGGGGGGAPVALVLRSLVAKSLVEPTVAESARYRMLETVRLFAQQRLLESGRTAELRDRHAAWFTHWTSSPPLDVRWLSFPWLLELRVELENLVAAIEWCLQQERWSQAGGLVANGAGLWIADVLAGQVVCWTARLLEHELDPHVRARLAVAGFQAATVVGEHDRILPWSSVAAELAGDDEPLVLAEASFWQAAPRMVPDPDAAAEWLAVADRATRSGQSALVRGVVASWRAVGDLCAPDRELPLVTLADIDWFGGRDSWSWHNAVQAGCVAAALAGDLELALELVASFSPLPFTAPTFPAGHEVLVTAIAGDVSRARALAAAFVSVVRRHSDTMWHAELALVAGILAVREGDLARGVAIIETARRGPMYMPYFYALARRYLREARAALPAEAVLAARAQSQRLTVEAILDELRAGRA